MLYAQYGKGVTFIRIVHGFASCRRKPRAFRIFAKHDQFRTALIKFGCGTIGPIVSLNIMRCIYGFP